MTRNKFPAYMGALPILIYGCASDPSPESPSSSASKIIEGIEYVEWDIQIRQPETSSQSLVPLDPEANYADDPIVFTEGHELPDFADFSLKELAMGLRSVFFDDDGKAYIEKEPKWELAQRIKDGEALQESFPSSDPFEGAGEIKPQYIFDAPGNVGTSDQRTIPPDTAPWNKIAWIDNSCSATYIAKHTILTAAHCVTNKETGTTWPNLRLYPYGWKGVHPHGSHLITSTSWVKVPVNWVLLKQTYPGQYTASMMAWDYAVIIVPDPLPAAMNEVGWAGYRSNQDANVNTEIYGYPRETPCPTAAGVWPRLCGHAGTGGYTNNLFLETDRIDASSGQSGGPWWWSSDRRPIGIYIAERRYVDIIRCGFSPCYRNLARRIDTAVKNFMATHSPDF